MAGGRYAIISSIPTLRQKLQKTKHVIPFLLAKTATIPVVLVIGGIFLAAFSGVSPSGAQTVFGGPAAATATAEGATLPQGDAFVTASEIPVDLADLPVATGSNDSVAGFVILDGSSVFGGASPVASNLPDRNGLITYRIQKGDTLSSVAASFGISLNTILWSNQSAKSRALHIGDEIVILPVSGIRYAIKPGDSVQSLAEGYGISADLILKYNPKASLAGIGDQSFLILPGAKPRGAAITSQDTSLPNYPGYYAIPTRGWNWGELHPVNAVDIANACGTPVYAAAEGLVSYIGLGYDSGYGNNIIIDHPNNTKTRYAHLLVSMSVSEGRYVSQGEQIAVMGNTGNVHGPTGCHLHFEVEGAKNPFVK